MNGIKSICKKNYMFIIFFLLMLCLHFFICPYGDDISHIGVAEKGEWVQQKIIEAFFTWSSRMLINALEMPFLLFPFVVWKVFDSLMMTAIAWISAKIIDEENTQIKIVSCLLWLIYPFSDMGTAGYCATTANYLWPLLAGLISIYLLKRQITLKKLSWWEYVIGIVCIMIASNQEQEVIALWIIFAAAIAYLIIKKQRISKFIYLQFFTTIAGIIFILVCPGNRSRSESEIQTWFPEFNDLSLFRKLEMGASSELFHFIIETNFIFFVFSIILLFATYKYARNYIEKTLCAIPCIISLCFSVLGPITYNAFPSLSYMKDALTEHGIFYFNDPKSIIPWILFAFVIIGIIGAIVCLSRKKIEYGIVAFATLSAGTLSRFIMCFSPTIWASSTRTYLFMYCSFIIVSLLLYHNMSNEKLKRAVLIIAGVLGMLSYFNTAVYLIDFF